MLAHKTAKDICSFFKSLLLIPQKAYEAVTLIVYTQRIGDALTFKGHKKVRCFRIVHIAYYVPKGTAFTLPIP